MIKLIVVDQNDTPLFLEEKHAVHAMGLTHRAFSVFVFHTNKAGKKSLLMQRRHPEKYHAGGLWSNTCCSHPFPQLSLKHCALRRLRFEMGITVPLHYTQFFHYRATFENGLIEDEVDHVFVGESKNKMPVYPHPQEVIETAWMPVTDVAHKAKIAPQQFTPWFLQALKVAWGEQMALAAGG